MLHPEHFHTVGGGPFHLFVVAKGRKEKMNGEGVEGRRGGGGVGWGGEGAGWEKGRRGREARKEGKDEKKGQ
jgi:hypothetical protein